MQLVLLVIGWQFDMGDDKGASDGLVGALGKVDSSRLDTTYL